MSTEIASLFARIGADTNQFDRAMGGVESKLHSVGGLLKTGLAVGAGAALAGVTALGAAIGKTAGDATGMEQKLADISATMGLGAEESAKLGKLITDLGVDPKLKVSATEAADAIGMLGQAGLSVDQILGGAARSTVLLANATGADMATAASVATDAMNLWSMDAANMGAAINGITGATIQSKFDINDYALALAQAGGVAAGLGVDFDDFNATIAATSSSFSSGSDAGTSFKTFLQRLLPQTVEGADMMRKLGLYTGLSQSEMTKAADKVKKLKTQIAGLNPTSKTYAATLAKLNGQVAALEDSMVRGKSAFYDAEGNMKSITDVADTMQRTFSGMSEVEQNDAMSTLFGADAMRTALELMNEGSAGINKMKTAIGDTSAEESAATRMDTLNGAWEIFMGNMEAISVMAGQPFLAPLQQGVEWLSTVVSKNKDAIIGFFTMIADELGHLVNIITMSENPLQDMATLFGIWAGKLWEFVSPKLIEFWTFMLGWLTDPARPGEAWKAIVGAWTFFVDWADKIYGMVAPRIGAFFTGLISWVTDQQKREQLINNIKQTWTGFQEWAGKIWTTVQPQLAILAGNINTWIDENAPVLSAWRDEFTTFVDEVKGSWSIAWPQIAGYWVEAQTKISTNIATLMTNLGIMGGWFSGSGGGGQMEKDSLTLAGKMIGFGMVVSDVFVALSKAVADFSTEIVLAGRLWAAVQAGDWGALNGIRQEADALRKQEESYYNLDTINKYFADLDALLLSRYPASGNPTASGYAAASGASANSLYLPSIVQNFYGTADAATVRNASQDGVAAALRAMGAH